MTAYHNNGYRYLKTGDPSGDLCKKCGREMYIDKSHRFDDKGKRIRGWLVRCWCGHEIEFQKNDKFTSAYK